MERNKARIANKSFMVVHIQTPGDEFESTMDGEEV